jgi:hypothetical protein
MADITVTLDRPDGTSEDVTVDLTLDSLTMRESVRLEAIIGQDVFSRLATDGLDLAEVSSPKIIQGLIFVKLKTRFPDVDLDAFDVDLDELAKAFDIDIPKASTPEGSTS